MTKRLQTYEAPGITVKFDPEVCTHSGRCVRGLPRVFNVKRKRWIQLEHEDADPIAAQTIHPNSSSSEALRYGAPLAHTAALSTSYIRPRPCHTSPNGTSARLVNMMIARSRSCTRTFRASTP